MLGANETSLAGGEADLIRENRGGLPGISLFATDSALKEAALSVVKDAVSESNGAASKKTVASKKNTLGKNEKTK
jgi:hypothetical protein